MARRRMTQPTTAAGDEKARTGHGKPGARAGRRRRSPGRPADSALYVGADTLVLKACELLREVAPGELSLLKLARYAGVDRSLIRYYFKDRSSLLFAAARYLFDLMRSRLLALEVPPDDPELRIRLVAVAMLQFQIEHPYFHRLLTEEVVSSPKSEARAFFHTLTERGVANFRATAAATQCRGARTYDGVFLYLAIIGMCEIFVTSRPVLKVAFGAEFDPEEVNRQYAEFLREYVIDGIRKR